MSINNLWKNQKFVRKFLIIISLAVLISSIALVLILQNQESKNQVEREGDQITLAEGFITSTIKKDFETLKGFATLIANNAEVAEALYYATLAGDTAELDKIIKKYPQYLDITNLEVLDKNGIIQSAFANPDEKGKDISKNDFVTEALKGKAETSLHKGEGGWALKAAAPVHNQEELIGALVVGKYLSTDYCNYLKEMSGFEVSFITGNEIFASSIAEENGRVLAGEEAAQFTTEGQSFDRKIGNNRYLNLPITIFDDMGDKIATAVVSLNMSSVDLRKARRTRGIIITLILVMAIVLTASFFIARTTVAPLGELAGVVKIVASGDLTNEPTFDSADEIGGLATDLRTMLNNLRQMIGQTISSSQTIDTATSSLLTEIESTNSSIKSVADTLSTLNKGASVQKKEIDMMSSRLNELNSSAEEIAASAESTSSNAQDAFKAAEEGGASVKDAVNVMQALKTSSGEAVETVSKLSDEAKKIGNIVGAITSIAEQTNLLALNAAIEAARAGEQGRGFAVVADEVRKLAENSAESAGEIASLISGIQKSVDNAVQVIQVSNENAEKGAEVVTLAGNSLENILILVRNITGKINDISAAAQEQSASFTEVVQSMKNVSDVVSSTTSESQKSAEAIKESLTLTESLTGSSQEMKNLAQELLDLMSNFKIEKRGSSATGITPRNTSA